MDYEKIEDSIFKYNPSDEKWPKVSSSMIEDFQKNGFLIVRNLFSTFEINKVTEAITNSEEFWTQGCKLADSSNRTYGLYQWTEPGDDILGAFGKNTKTIGVAEQIMDRGELYIYSGKTIMKQERTGGEVHWHQDYGYWYNNLALFPDFITCVIAMTKSDRENGGLQLIKGSHKCGRIEHSSKAGQTGADAERVEIMLKNLNHIYAELGTGDALFFHGNILHKSDPNISEFKRWHLIYSYNCKHNSPLKKHYAAQYTEPVQTLDAQTVTNIESLEIEKRDWVDNSKNPNVKAIKH